VRASKWPHYNNIGKETANVVACSLVTDVGNGLRNKQLSSILLNSAAMIVLDIFFGHLSYWCFSVTFLWTMMLHAASLVLTVLHS
jgi:hypothetical protein